MNTYTFSGICVVDCTFICTIGLFVITISSGEYLFTVLDGDRKFGLMPPFFIALCFFGLSKAPSSCGIFNSTLKQ